ncbi:hypothetical protein [Paludisphaera borealis]|uniref:Uncharacterized protein n=1 Tax=Paludisphaera borealis TaxID=1387353 RepID=A0A1U7CID2_9BACT|nr:hypothetical protein [Paludisphaera borealis]APW58692.1 hypothetical protein BSF38_00092 [Paludisphaera borealis]
MRRRMIGLSSLLAASILATGLGCESLRHATRVHDDKDKGDHAKSVTGESLEPTAVDADVSKLHAVDSDPKASASPFFKNNRKPGALSSEARDIERSLGVQ